MSMQGLDLAPKQETLSLRKLILAGGRYVSRGKPRIGGLAQVYCATDTETGETVAVKIFRGTGVSDDIVEESPDHACPAAALIAASSKAF
jgi:hypothetical protein